MAMGKAKALHICIFFFILPPAFKGLKLNSRMWDFWDIRGPETKGPFYAAH